MVSHTDEMTIKLAFDLYDLDGTRQIKKEDAIRAIQNLGYILTKEQINGINTFT